MGEYVPGAMFKIAFASNPRGYFEPDGGVRKTINSLGLRGEEVRPEKPPGTYRILGLGDSITFGVGVRDSDTFLRQLQARLNSNAPEGRRFEALNAGVQGYNTRDQAACLEFRWLELRPDLVLVFFYINDAYDDTAILNMGQELDVHAKKPSGLARYSRVADMVQHKYRSYTQSKAMEAYYRQHYFSDARRFLANPERIRVDWQVSRTAIARMAQITRERNVKLGLVMFPEFYNLKRGYPFVDIHALVREACAEEKIPFLDLLDTFRGRDEATLWVHPTDHHPNETAHLLASGAIEKFVREKFLEVAKPANSSGAAGNIR
jgi:lysophospholipase L1-like esterase